MEAVISTRDLRKSFTTGQGRARRQVEAVRGVSFEVGPGEIFGFLGPNGAGKTTTLRMLTTLLPADSGSATVAGFDVTRQPAQVRARIGYVSQLGGADELATGRENLILQGQLYGGGRARVAARAAELAGLLELAGFADRRAGTYSGGQRRRLDVALGIVHQPAVLFLDEPTTGLDPQSRANLWEHIRGLRGRGTTVFLTTHYLDEADTLCDRVMIMDHGRIVADGTPRALKQQVAGDAITIAIRPDRPRGGTDGDGPGRQVLDRLRQEPYVRELAAAGRQLRLYVDDGGSALPRLIRLLDAEGTAIRSITMSEPTLDDVFLRQTGRSLREPEPGGAAGEGPDGPDGPDGPAGTSQDRAAADGRGAEVTA